jgi:hypothetical protein
LRACTVSKGAEPDERSGVEGAVVDRVAGQVGQCVAHLHLCDAQLVLCDLLAGAPDHVAPLGCVDHEGVHGHWLRWT